MKNRIEKNVGRGHMVLPLIGNAHFVVYGGPYKGRHGGMAGVKLAKEISAPCFVDLPIQDFGVPQVKDTIRAVEEALVLIAVCRRPVYAGCMGGIGRTGLFLALLAKAFGVTKPVEYVRQNYYSHAVETKEQFDFVASFPITPAMRKIIKGAKFRWFWRQALSTNLTKSIDKP